MKKIILLISIPILFISIIYAQSKSEIEVTNTVNQFTKAMIDADSITLDKLTEAKLSYGHSSGWVDDKKSFINKLASGKSDFVTIELTEQTIIISGKIAIVRHELNATTNDNGKSGEVHLKVLLVFKKHRHHWKLLARQAIKKL